MIKARKGDYAVVQTFEQSTAMHGGSTSRARFRFAVVSKADRAGVVAAMIPTGQSAPIKAADAYHWWIVRRDDVLLPALYLEQPHAWETLAKATDALLAFKA